MSWASNRETSREEDIAYCLLGVFNVQMPLLYGEGSNAFIRLQEEIMRHSTDQSHFAWYPSAGDLDTKPRGILASHPREFVNSASYVPTGEDTDPYSMTNKGLQIQLRMMRTRFERARYTAILVCHDGHNLERIGITLESIPWTKYCYGERGPHGRCLCPPYMVGESKESVRRNRIGEMENLDAASAGLSQTADFLAENLDTVQTFTPVLRFSLGVFLVDVFCFLCWLRRELGIV